MKFSCSLIAFTCSLFMTTFCFGGQAEETTVKKYFFSGMKEIVAQHRSRSAYAWEGEFEVDGIKGDLFDIPTRNGSVIVMRLMDGRIIHHLPAANDIHTVIFEERKAIENCQLLTPDAALSDQQPAQRRFRQCDDGGVIDVLMKWTPEAAAESGGDVQIRSLAEACISLSNHVYAQSGITTRLRAVGFGVTESYSGDAGDDQLLYKITDPNDGVLDGLHAERDAVGADLVAVLQGESNFWCGVAWLFEGPGNGSLGFSLTSWTCALSNLSFTHEVGHNQGCCHAAGDGGGCQTGGYFTYSKGHRAIFAGSGQNSFNYSTVMAYADSRTYFRAPRFSNPGVTFADVPTGVSGDSENARTINETAVDIANYRCAIIPADGSVAHLMSNGIGLPGSSGETIEVIFENVLPADQAGDVTVTFRGMRPYGGGIFAQMGALDLGTVFSSDNPCRAAVDARSIDANVFNEQLAVDRSLTFQISGGGSADFCDDLSIMVTYVAEGDCTPDSPDSDADGTPDCDDGCPDDPEKVDVGLCGCGISDVDTDLDGVPDCTDGCPNDVNKTEPGVCGCGVSDEDLNDNGIPDCNDDGDGQTIVVDDDLQQDPNADYTRIQDAVDAAEDGTTILVQPGRYTGSADNVVFIQGKGVRLIGVGGYKETIIDCEDARGGIRAELSSTHTLVVEGFTVQSYSGCFSAGGDPPSCNSGILVVADPGSTATIQSCVIRDGLGFALNMVGRSSNNGNADLLVRDTMVLDNVGPSNNGADWLMAASYSASRYESCAFIGNTAGQMMLCYWTSTEFYDCVFVDNELVPVTGPYPGTVLFHDPIQNDTMTISECRFVESSIGCVIETNGTDDVQINRSSACSASGIPTLCGKISAQDIVLTDVCADLDCNENGITDAIEIFNGTLNDVDRNGIPDCCESGGSCGDCQGDLNGDGLVDGQDLATLLSSWGESGADLTGDRVVDGADLALLLGLWGLCL